MDVNNCPNIVQNGFWSSKTETTSPFHFQAMGFSTWHGTWGLSRPNSITLHGLELLLQDGLGSWAPFSPISFGYGSIPINTIFRGMNIHLPAILMFTRGTRFWHTAISHTVALEPHSAQMPSFGLCEPQEHNLLIVSQMARLTSLVLGSMPGTHNQNVGVSQSWGVSKSWGPWFFFHQFWMILGFPFEEPPPNVGVLYDQGAFEVIPSEMGKSWKLPRLLRVVARLNFKNFKWNSAWFIIPSPARQLCRGLATGIQPLQQCLDELVGHFNGQRCAEGCGTWYPVQLREFPSCIRRFPTTQINYCTFKQQGEIWNWDLRCIF